MTGICLFHTFDFQLSTLDFRLSVILHKIIRHVIAQDFFRLSQHLPEDRFKQRLAIRNRRYAQRGVLPDVFVIQLGHGDVETRPQPIAHLAQDSPLFLEGVSVGKLNLQGK
jgi:hypothetical protein